MARAAVVSVLSTALLAVWSLEADAQQPGPGAAPSPSAIARSLAEQGAVVDVPEKGQIRQEIEKDAPTFQTPGGLTTAMLLRLPAFQAPYRMSISSFKRGLGPATKIFVPNGISFDSQFRPLSRFGDENLQVVGDRDRLVVTLMIGDALAEARYFLLFTRPSQVEQRLETEKSARNNSIKDRVASLLGVGRVERSLEATIYVATAPPEETPIARKLGGPWQRVEGANELKVQQLLGPPSSMERQRNLTIWTYDKTSAGKVRVYIIDDVASLRPPQ